MNFNCLHYFQDAKSVIEPKNCALIIGLTYFFSAILSLVKKNLIGRRILLLMSQLGMAVSQIALGVYFYILAQRTPVNIVSERNSESSNTTVHNVTYIIDEEEVDLEDKISWHNAEQQASSQQ